MSGKKYQDSIAKEGMIEKLDVLLSQSYDSQIDLNNSNDVALFYIASMSNSVDLLKKFINSGFPVDSPLKTNPDTWTDLQIHSGFTGLHFAFKYHRLEAIQYLLSQGASIFIADDQGMTPLHILFETKKEMLEKQSSLETYDQIIEMILEHNQLKSNMLGDNEISNFHIACTSDKPDVIERFLLSGVCIDQTVETFINHKGFSPLHFAVNYDCTKVVKLLLKSGANVSLLDHNNRSAMHLIDSPEIAELFLQHSVHLMSEDLIDTTPLENLFQEENYLNLQLLDFANNIDDTDVEEDNAESSSKSVVTKNTFEPIHIEIEYSGRQKKESSIFGNLHEPSNKMVKIYVDVEQDSGLLNDNNNIESNTDGNLLNQEYVHKFCPKCNMDLPTENQDKYCKICNSLLRRQCKRCNKRLATQSITDHLNTTCVMKKHFFNCSKCSYRAKSQLKVYSHWKVKHATCDFENDGLTHKQRLEKVTCRKEGTTLTDLKRRNLIDKSESDAPNASVDSKKDSAKRRKKIQSESVDQENAPIVLTLQ